MAPLHQTAEYKLLSELVEKAEVPADKLNQLALTKAIDEGYVKQEGDLVWITNDGLDRLDELEG